MGVRLRSCERQENRWVKLGVSVVVLLFAGIIYAWSILKAPFAVEFEWSASQLAFAYTLSLCFHCIGQLSAGILLKRLSPRVLLLLSAACMGGGLASLSRVESTTLSLLYIGYGVLGGVGSGLAYNATLSATNAWFPDKTGLSSGIQMMAFGLSAFLLGTLADRMMASEQVGWRVTYLTLGIGAALALALGSFVISFPKIPARPTAVQKKAEQVGADLSAAQMLKRSSFWRFYVMMICMCAVGNVTISMSRDLALSVGAGAVLATMLAGVLSVCNGVGRLLCGALVDRLGYRKIMYVSGALAILAPVITLLSILIQNLPLCILGLCLVGISYGFCPPATSAFMIGFYGRKNFALNFSLANTMLIPTSFFASLSGVLITWTGSFAVPFLMLIVLAAAAMVLNLSIRRP